MVYRFYISCLFYVLSVVNFMKRRDIKIGSIVYHTVYTRWGKGIVEAIERVNLQEALFETGKYRVVVQFSNHVNTTRVISSLLRKTPNRKKICQMVEMYHKRGVDAQDGGDCLLLPQDSR